MVMCGTPIVAMKFEIYSKAQAICVGLGEMQKKITFMRYKVSFLIGQFKF